MVDALNQESKVGYKRPPRQTQFQKGQSGNPKGRPNQANNLEADLREELADRISIREGERHIKVSKQRALLKALLSKALRGDTRAAGLVIQLIAKVIPVDVDSGSAPEVDLGAADLAIIERFLERRAGTSKKT